MSVSESYFLGIDNGGTMSKAALFDQNGNEISCCSRKVDIIELHPGWSERDANEMWSKTAEAIHEVVCESGVDISLIKAIGCTGHGNGLYLIDETGTPVRNAINSTDSRAAGYIDDWKKQGVDEKVLSKTAQCLWPAQPNALLSWMRDFEPESLKKAKWIQFAKDFIRTQLTGEISMERTDMSGSSLMNVVTGEYDDEVLSMFGLLDMKSMFPDLINSHNICGCVTLETSKITGLKAGTPVVGGMFDIDACALASGIIDEGQMSLVAGTWGNNQYIAREPLIDKGIFMTSCYSIPGWYLMLEGSPTSASNLEWFVSQFYALERQQNVSVFETCDEAVNSISPEDHHVIFLPFLYGTNEDSSAKSSFLGIQNHHTRSDMLRAVYEGIVFSHYHHLNRLLRFREKPKCIRFTGGAAKSEVWVQMFADCFQVAVEIPAGSELGALGAAIAGAVGSGRYSSYEEAIGNMTHIAKRYEPNPGKAEVYQTKYRRYKKAVRILDELWDSET